MLISASILYNYLMCPHRIWRDKYGPQDEKDPEPNPFVQLLWERGISHEEKVIDQIGLFEDISQGTKEERYQRTLAALKKGTSLIYQGVLMTDCLLGIPDLMRRNADGSYIPVDIKSGTGFEGANESEDEEGKPKKHYAVQLSLYADLLIQHGFVREKKGVIIDIHGKEVVYDLAANMGVKTPQTYWEFYNETVQAAERLLTDQEHNKPARVGACKLCPWYASCKKWCVENHDLTNLFYVGRNVRDTINEDLEITKVEDLVGIDIAALLEKKKKDKSFLQGLAEKSLTKYKNRARVSCVTKKPVLYQAVELPSVPYELFFDIEDDPTQEFVYMHGVYERSAKGERYLDFTATEVSDAAEKAVWKAFWDYIATLPQGDFSVYYYAPHEKTIYRKLQRRYPDVISEEKLEEFFANEKVIDLYNAVIQKLTDWPLASYSLKDIAIHLGFQWRDETPSGALSIQWFNEYLKAKDPKILQRIREYNEDDCKATMVVKDGVMGLM